MPAPSPAEWYRIGDGHLAVRSDDAALRSRLRELHADCLVAEPVGDGPRVTCTVRVRDGWMLASYEDPEPLDVLAFAQSAFSDRGYVEGAAPTAGWRRLEAEAPLAIAGDDVLAEAGAPWQRFVGNLAVSRVLRLQRDTVFYHAAAVALGGRSVLLVGPKGSGKTTLALALGALGCAFQGDELVGVRPGTGALVPVRRSVTIKPGPAAAAVRTAVARTAPSTERFLDGIPRQRVAASLLFPDAWGPAPALGAIVFLDGFAAAPRLVRLAPARAHAARLTPLAVSLWGVSPTLRAAQLLSLVARVPCYLLDPGSPEETAALVVRIMEE